MAEFRFVRVQKLGAAGWAKLLFALALVIGIGIAIAIVAVSLLLILVPVIAVASAIYYLFGRPSPRARRSTPGIIDAEFRVLDADRIERGPPRQNSPWRED